VVLGLIELGTASEGPITAAARAVGTGVSRLESRLARRFRGPGREADLTWLEPLRTHADSLRHPDTLLLGAYDGRLPESLEGVIEVEEALGTTFPLIQLYTAWGDAPDQEFPLRTVEAIHELGSIPVMTWEPWLTPFENRLHPELPLRENRDQGGLRDIARGLYDFYLDEWLAVAADLDYPILVRFAHEMNDPYRYPWGPQNNEPQHFIAAWRHVVDRARLAGADNIVWVWSPHIAYDGYEVYWPGDDYVGWVATGGLNYGTVAYWSQWWSFQEIFGGRYDFLAGFGKPIMIAEFGTLTVGGDRADWYRGALTDFRDRFPAVHALLFFHVDDDDTVTRQAVDWGFLGEGPVVEAIRETLTCTGCPDPSG
jgi:hypothetical protein